MKIYLLHSPGERAADDIVSIVKYTGYGDQEKGCDTAFDRCLLDDKSRSNDAEERDANLS